MIKMKSRCSFEDRGTDRRYLFSECTLKDLSNDIRVTTCLLKLKISWQHVRSHSNSNTYTVLLIKAPIATALSCICCQNICHYTFKNLGTSSKSNAIRCPKYADCHKIHAKSRIHLFEAS